MSRMLQSPYQYQHDSCALCGLQCAEELNFMFCSNCRVVVYCSKEHQVAHWKQHKKFCRDHLWVKDSSVGPVLATSCSIAFCPCKKWFLETEPKQSQSSDVTNIPTPSAIASDTDRTISTPNVEETWELVDDFLRSSAIEANILKESDLERFGSAKLLEESFSSGTGDSPTKPGYEDASMNPLQFKSFNLDSPPKSSVRHPQQVGESLAGSQGDCISAPSTAMLGSPNASPSTSSVLFAGVENTGSTSVSTSSATLATSHTESSQDNLSGTKDGGQDSEGSVSASSINLLKSNAAIPFQHTSDMRPLTGRLPAHKRILMLQVWMQQVIEDLNLYGVCVLDNLLGEARGNAILREVHALRAKGAFEDGKLVKAGEKSTEIRSDKIKWLQGDEENCNNIFLLLKILDNIVMGANRVAKDGQLSKYSIRERSKAMVACYPGSGSHYVKHVDNPNDDGRCITCIYYLNKDWNTKVNGGLLRIFPEGYSNKVADVAPLFDRVIFFWSDRRNPHEVQPSFKTRYAITLWYYDSPARARFGAELEKKAMQAALNAS